jgi:hypothetical protein
LVAAARIAEQHPGRPALYLLVMRASVYIYGLEGWRQFRPDAPFPQVAIIVIRYLPPLNPWLPVLRQPGASGRRTDIDQVQPDRRSMAAARRPRPASAAPCCDKPRPC